MRKSVWISGLILTVAMMGCAYQHELLVNPKVDVPPTVSTADVQKSVHKAFTSYGWTIDQEETGSTAAHLQKDQLYASVRVDYNQKEAVVRYVDSKNFRYSKSPKGEERIHGHYLVWVRNIANRVQEKLNAIAQ